MRSRIVVMKLKRSGERISRISGETKAGVLCNRDCMAEGEGFEPPVRFPVQWFSRPPVSTAHASLRRNGALVYRLSKIKHIVATSLRFTFLRHVLNFISWPLTLRQSFSGF